MAGFAIRTSFAGHASNSARADNALTFKLDHHMGQATKRQGENIFLHVLALAGDEPFAGITKKTISAGIDRQRDTPFQARNFLQAMRGPFRWAVKAEHVESDPTDSLEASRPRTEGFSVWSEQEIELFEARWPLGTRQRVAFDILLYTGLRRGDAVALGRHHIKDGVARLKTEKTGEMVFISIEPELSENSSRWSVRRFDVYLRRGRPSNG